MDLSYRTNKALLGITSDGTRLSITVIDTKLNCTQVKVEAWFLYQALRDYYRAAVFEDTDLTNRSIQNHMIQDRIPTTKGD